MASRVVAVVFRIATVAARLGRVPIFVFEFGFVEDRRANFVFLAGPVAEIEQPAAFAAEREIGTALRVRWLAADGTACRHFGYLAVRIGKSSPRRAGSLAAEALWAEGGGANSIARAIRS